MVVAAAEAAAVVEVAVAVVVHVVVVVVVAAVIVVVVMTVVVVVLVVESSPLPSPPLPSPPLLAPAQRSLAPGRLRLCSHLPPQAPAPPPRDRCARPRATACFQTEADGPEAGRQGGGQGERKRMRAERVRTIKEGKRE